IDHRSDIYALGIVAFELFTGRVPFRGGTPLDTILKHIHETVSLEGPGTEALPPPLVPVLREALAKSPDERFASAADFAAAVAEARDAAGIAPLPRRAPTPDTAAAAGPLPAGDAGSDIPTIGEATWNRPMTSPMPPQREALGADVPTRV